MSYVNCQTCDRKRTALPRHYRVESVIRNENSRLWQHYYIARGEAQHRLNSMKDLPGEKFREYEVRTHEPLLRFGEGIVDPVDSRCNEWYLFHGTSEDCAKTICHTGFKMSFAGSHAGTLYGRGSYFAESITKADEYSTA